jgi:hypothetical protein
LASTRKRGVGSLTTRAGVGLTALAVLGAALLAPPPPAAGEAPRRDQILERLRERLSDPSVDHPLLHAHQAASLDHVYYRPYTPEQEEALEVALPEGDEVMRFLAAREGIDSQALELLDEFYGQRDGLKAVAVRDRDGDGMPDYRVSDYYGKLSEGDVDVDGDGVRNVYDDAPYDPSQGGHDDDGDGIPDSAFADTNGNGLPDHVDWALHGKDREMAEIQLGLFRDHKILLVERDADFDLPLARAADDVVRRVFRAYFEKSPVLPTLRTIAVEKTALLHSLLALLAEDETSAQVFSQTQSLTVYDPGRETEDALGLLGLFAHEMGHSYHMALDWDASHPDLENRRTDFPAPNFVKTVARFGWTVDGYYDGRFEGTVRPEPQFLYIGISEPVFLLKGRSPDDWEGWLNAIWEEMGEPEDYLTHPSFVKEEVVGDYSLTSPYEWYGDNLLAYVVTVLEETALERIASGGSGPEVEAAQELARERLMESLRAVWPGFDHRNIGREARAYFGETFPIREDDRQLLVERYILPIIEH